MKTLLAVVTLCAMSVVPAFGEKQPRPDWPVDDNGRVVFQKIVKVDGVEAVKLYDRARAWFSETYVSGESVLDLEDREAGRLIGKGVLELPGMGFYVIQHTLTVEVKDDRYRYALTNITWSGGKNPPTPPRPMTDKGNIMGMLMRKQDARAWEYVNGLISSLEAAMLSSESEDW